MKSFLALVSTLCVCLPSLVQAGGVAGAPVVVVLKQFADGDRHFFFNGYDYGLRFLELPASQNRRGYRSVLQSNIAVFADASLSPEVEIQSAIESWVDSRGHIHTVSVLRKQMSFNRDRRLMDRRRRLSERREELTSRFGYLEVDRDGLTEVRETGIVDTATVHIPYYTAALRLGELQLRFFERCVREAGHPCRGEKLPNALFEHWQKEIDRAGESAAALKARMDAIPVSGQPWIGLPRNWSDVFRGEFGGLTDMPMPIHEPGSALYGVLRRGDPVTIYPSRFQPEKEVVESVPPEALDRKTLDELESLEKTAHADIQKAENLEPDLFGDTP